MTKQELAKKKSSEVRNNTALFSLLKNYIIEDWGAIPSSCFGCEFNKYFKKWAKPYLENTEVIKLNLKNNNMNIYQLKNENFKTYYKGEVLSKNSSDAEWSDYINNIESEIENRKSLFLVLPPDISTDAEKAKEIKVVAEILEKKTNDLTPPAVVNQKKKRR